jgi:hypothetical protein
MLHAKDLMIGDWVYIEHTEDGVAPYKEVICIKAEDLCRDACIIETHYEPIPLTPEILEKNGFKKLSFSGWEFDYEDEDEVLKYKILWRNDYPKNYSTHLTVNSFSADFGSFKSFNIKYVHELQHVLRLCGIEKEIEL